MSKIKELFFKEALQEGRNVNHEDVIKFIEYLNNVGDEGTQFDAKDFGKVLDNNDNISFDKVKTELGKHVSAFSNTSGGLIALGIREDKNESNLFDTNNYDLSRINIQYLQRALATSVEPRPEFYLEVVEMESIGKINFGIVLIFIEQSMNPPHQVIYNRTYYFRNGESSNPAPHSLVSALFSYRKRPNLTVNLIKLGKPPYQRLLIKNGGNAPALHTHIIINIYPRLQKNGEIFLNKKMIERTTDGMWNIKSFLGTSQKNFMKFRFRARPGQILLPGVNEILFDIPYETVANVKIRIDLYCEGFEAHQELDLF